MDPKVSTETPNDCLKLLQDYLPKEFESLTEEDIDVQVQTGGLVNRMKLVTIKSTNYKVLIREYGGNFLDGEKLRSFLPPVSYQLLIFHELSKMKIGPRLLGVFEGGRIEEFIPSHTLKPDEFNDDGIIKDVAINTAIIHSLKLPFSQRPANRFDLMTERYRTFMNGTDLEKFCENFKTGILDCGADYELFKTIVNTDWSEEASNLKKIIDTFHPKTGLILWDTNHLNVLIRDDPKPGQLKVCLIDYEFCRYDNPVPDIASRFCNQLINFGGKGKDKATGFQILEESKRRNFIREYLKETKWQKVIQAASGQSWHGKNSNGFVADGKQEVADGKQEVADSKQEVAGGKQEVAVDEEEVDEWMYECDHFIPLIMIHFTLVMIITDMFMQRDVTWVFIAETMYKNYLEWKKCLKTKYGTTF